MAIDAKRFYKSEQDRIGYVADYCPVCRALRAFALYHITQKRKGWMAAMAEEAEESGYARVCKTCTGAFDAHPDDYTGMAPRLLDIFALQAETFANYPDVYAEQIRLDHIPAMQLMGQDRIDRIQDPMLAISVATEQRTANLKMDTIAGGLLGLAVVLLAVAWPQLVAAGDNVMEYPPLLVGPAVVAVIVAFIRIVQAGQRETLRWATRHLANALAPMRPSDPELERALDALRERKLWLVSKWKVPTLQAAFETHRQSPEPRT